MLPPLAALFYQMHARSWARPKGTDDFILKQTMRVHASPATHGTAWQDIYGVRTAAVTAAACAAARSSVARKSRSVSSSWLAVI